MFRGRYNLQRFVFKQKEYFDIAYKEICSGQKKSHWMWYIFPQIIGLGNTKTAVKYAIKSMDEAKAYLKDEYLGANLKKISKALLELDTNDAHEIFGTPDDLKLCSCMTLFSLADTKETIFQRVLEKYYDGKLDSLTLDILQKQSN